MLPEKESTRLLPVMRFISSTLLCFALLLVQSGRAQQEVDRSPGFDDRVRILSDSDDYRHLLAAALLASPDETRHTTGELFTRALAATPDSYVVLASVLEFCLRSDDDPICQMGALLERLAKADPGNALTWIFHVRHALDHGRKEDALEFLKRSAASSTYDTLFVAHYEVFHAAVTAVEGTREPELSLWAIGMAASHIHGVQIARLCRDGLSPKLDHDWTVTCLRLGRLMYEKTQTSIPMLAGLNIERSMLEKLDAKPADFALLDERKRNFAALQDRSRFINEFAEHYAFDHPLMLEYFNLLTVVGEIEAVERTYAAIVAQKLWPLTDELASGTKSESPL